VLDRRNKALLLPSEAVEATHLLQILVENQGRINVGQEMVSEAKGILRGVTVGDRFLANWTMYPLPFEQDALARASLVSCNRPRSAEPTLFTGSFTANETRDTFLDMRGWTKGVAFLNGRNLGRFWTVAGPQRALFVPSSFLRDGRNTIVVLDLETPFPPASVSLIDTPLLA